MPPAHGKIREAGVNELNAQQKELPSRFSGLRFQLTTGQPRRLKRLAKQKKISCAVKNATARTRLSTASQSPAQRRHNENGYRNEKQCPER